MRGDGVTTTSDANIHGVEDGIEDVLCRANYHPYKTYAKHRNLRTVRSYEDNLYRPATWLCSLYQKLAFRGHWVTSTKTHQPEDWRLDTKLEWTTPRLIELV